MVADGEAVHGRPQPPPRPPSDVGVCLARDNHYDQVAHVGGDNGAAAEVGLVAEVRKAEDHDQREGGPYGSEGVGGDAVKTEGPIMRR